MLLRDTCTQSTLAGRLSIVDGNWRIRRPCGGLHLRTSGRLWSATPYDLSTSSVYAKQNRHRRWHSQRRKLSRPKLDVVLARLNSVVKPSPRATRLERASWVHTATSPDIRRGRSRSRARTRLSFSLRSSEIWLCRGFATSSNASRTCPLGTRHFPAVRKIPI